MQFMEDQIKKGSVGGTSTQPSTSCKSRVKISVLCTITTLTILHCNFFKIALPFGVLEYGTHEACS